LKQTRNLADDNLFGELRDERGQQSVRLMSILDWPWQGRSSEAAL